MLTLLSQKNDAYIVSGSALVGSYGEVKDVKTGAKLIQLVSSGMVNPPPSPEIAKAVESSFDMSFSIQDVK